MMSMVVTSAHTIAMPADLLLPSSEDAGTGAFIRMILSLAEGLQLMEAAQDGRRPHDNDGRQGGVTLSFRV
jgi:hypothetical protein